MFQVGDKVRLINDAGAPDNLTLGGVYTIRRADPDDTVKVQEDRYESWLMASRFEKVEDTPPPRRKFVAGDRVRVVNIDGDFLGLLKLDAEYVIVKVEDSSARSGQQNVFIHHENRENSRGYYGHRFELVEPVVDDRPLAVGDVVYLTYPTKTAKSYITKDGLDTTTPYVISAISRATLMLKGYDWWHMTIAFSRVPGSVNQRVTTPAMVDAKEVLAKLIAIGDPKADPLAASMKMSDLIDDIQKTIDTHV